MIGLDDFVNCFLVCGSECSLVEKKSVEWIIQKKAVATQGFPFKDVINEFLLDRDKVPRTSIVWSRPKLFHTVVGAIDVHFLFEVMFTLSSSDSQGIKTSNYIVFL